MENDKNQPKNSMIAYFILSILSSLGVVLAILGVQSVFGGDGLLDVLREYI